MDLASWAESVDPGPREQFEHHIKIRHRTLGASTLWRRDPTTLLPRAIDALEWYEVWDGADLFSSAFKLASVAGPRSVSGVAIVPGIADLEAQATCIGWRLPPGAVPFMVGSGQWLYAATSAGRVLEFDLEQLEPGAEFEGVEQVLREWLTNVAP